VSIKLKHVAELIANGDEAGALPYVALENVESWTGRLATPFEDLPNRESAESGICLVEPGDVLFGKLRPYLAKTWRTSDRLYASSELMAIRGGRLVGSRWLGYLAASRAMVEWAIATSEGVKMPRTSWEKLREFEIYQLPSLHEQDVAANYLDLETQRIDSLIDKKQRMIALLTERRTAVLGSLVDGSGPSVAVRFVTSRITSGPRGWSDFASESGSPFIRITNVQRRSIELDMTDTLLVTAPSGAESHRTRVVEGDVLVTITADIGSVGVVRKKHAGAFVSQHIALLTPKGCRPEWLAFAIASPGSRASLDASQYGGTKTQLSLGDVAALRIPVPNLDEQDRVIEILRRETRRLEHLNQHIDSQIALLKERRQALITATVTGQLEIPEVAA